MRGLRMRCVGAAMLAVLASRVAACASQPDPLGRARDGAAGTAARAILREVQVGTGVVVLGAPLRPEVAAASPGDTVIVLARGSVAGAARALVHRARDGSVSAVTIDYLLDTGFDTLVAGYERTLGPATRSTTVRGAESPADVATWSDGRTELRIVRDPNRSAWTIRVTLRDLADGAPRSAPAPGS
ncbi:MAG TPA: hypothetical protein VFZ11_13530 [Gemmatimonadaceae bacterium]